MMKYNLIKRLARRVSLSLVCLTMAAQLQAGVTAISGDGNNSYVLVGTPDALQIPSQAPFTIEAWVYLKTLNSRDIFYCKNRSRTSPYTYMFGCADSGDITAYTGSSWVKPDPKVKVTLKEWQHLAYSFDGTDITFYLNGISLGASTYSFSNKETWVADLIK